MKLRALRLLLIVLTLSALAGSALFSRSDLNVALVAFLVAGILFVVTFYVNRRMLQSGTYPTTGGGLLLFKLLLIIVALINGTYLYMNYQTLALLEGDTQNLIPLLGMQAYGILAPVVLVLLMPANRKKAALAKARTARIEPNIEL